MNIGDYADAQALADFIGEDSLRRVLTHAEAGQFNAPFGLIGTTDLDPSSSISYPRCWHALVQAA